MRNLLLGLLLTLVAASPAWADPKVGGATEQGAEKSQSTDVPDKTGASAGAARSEGTAEGRQTSPEKKADGSGR